MLHMLPVHAHALWYKLPLTFATIAAMLHHRAVHPRVIVLCHLSAKIAARIGCNGSHQHDPEWDKNAVM